MRSQKAVTTMKHIQQISTTQLILLPQRSSTRVSPNPLPQQYRAMPVMGRYSFLLLIGLAILSVNGCGSHVKPQTDANSPSPSSGSMAQSPPSTAQPFAITPSSTSSGESLPSVATSSPTSTSTTVTIYKADDQCEKLIPETIQVPADRALEDTVGHIINAQDTLDFQLGGYRINLDNDGMATIDLRLIPNPRRQIASLSTCEQFALFGSLKETLTRNPTWNIKSVRFTERGKEIVF